MSKQNCFRQKGLYFLAYGLTMLIFLAAGSLAYAEDMAAVIAGAKKEGKLVYYTGMTMNPDVTLMVQEFEKKYPFVKVEVLRLNGETLLTRALAEARAKNLRADIFQASIVQVSQMKQHKLLMKYIDPESKAYGKKFSDPDGFWTATYILPYVITYNTKLVSKQDAPKSYEDLLNPKWKGKIGSDAQGYQWFFHLIKIMGQEKGMDYMTKLAKQNLIFRHGPSLLLSLCIAGEIDVLLVGYLNNVQLQQSRGAPIDWVRFKSFPTITAINAISVVANASHPNAAKLFYNFNISRDGVRVLRDLKRIPALPGEQPPDIKGLDLYVAFPEEMVANYKQTEKDWNSVFRRTH